MPTKQEVGRATARGERIRDEIAHRLARAREPTTVGELQEVLPGIDPRDIVFQVSRMRDEGTVTTRGKSRYVLAPGAVAD